MAEFIQAINNSSVWIPLPTLNKLAQTCFGAKSLQNKLKKIHCNYLAAIDCHKQVYNCVQQPKVSYFNTNDNHGRAGCNDDYDNDLFEFCYSKYSNLFEKNGCIIYPRFNVQINALHIIGIMQNNKNIIHPKSYYVVVVKNIVHRHNSIDIKKCNRCMEILYDYIPDFVEEIDPEFHLDDSDYNSDRESGSSGYSENDSDDIFDENGDMQSHSDDSDN